MSDPHVTNGELVERIARLEAKLDASACAVDLRFKAEERADLARERVLDMRFEQGERAVATALHNSDKAVQKSETASEKRFDATNEFRLSLSDAARIQMPRAEAEGLITALESKVDLIVKTTHDKIEQASKSAYDKTEQMSKVLAEKVDRIGAEIIALNALVASSTSKRQGESEGKKEGYGGISIMISGAIAVVSIVLIIASFLLNMRR